MRRGRNAKGLLRHRNHGVVVGIVDAEFDWVDDFAVAIAAAAVANCSRPRYR